MNNYKDSVHVIDSNNEPVKVLIHYFRTIEIDTFGSVKVLSKQKVKPFYDYQDYLSRLNDAIEKTIINSKDPNRSLLYGIVTTISKGYDAPCCAVIARKYGCNTAVTFSPKGKYSEDSGVEIANLLGYENIIERDGNAYLNHTDLAEAEQISSGELGSDMCFIVFDDDFKNNLVFTGDRGDSIWAKESPMCNDEYQFNDLLSHIGMQERRLWVGYVSVPMPLFGASSWMNIQKISLSEEMRPWQLNNNYDRPIPRRIVEEAGIDREKFGMNKHGAGINLRYDWGGRAKRRMSKTAAKSFSRYVKTNKRIHLIQLIRFFWNVKSVYLNRLGINVNDNTTLRERSQIANASNVRYLFPWAGEIMLDRYKNILCSKKGSEQV